LSKLLCWLNFRARKRKRKEVRFAKEAPRRFRCEPGGRVIEARTDGAATVVTLPPLEIHALLIGEDQEAPKS
jgi:hypothetical protein